MSDLKISQFADGGAIQETDEIATNRGGVNTKVFVGSAAALDVGSGVGDIVSFSDDGGGNPQYPAADGALITNLNGSAIIGFGDMAEQDSDDVNITGGTITVSNTGLNVLDSDGSHYLTIRPTTNLSANATLGISTSGSRTLTVSANATVSGTNTGDDVTAITGILKGNGSVISAAVNGADYIDPDENVVTANTGSSYNMDFAVAQNFALTMTANCTLNITNEPTEGGMVALKLIQDSTPRTPTFGITGLSWANGVAPTIPSGSGDYIVLVFVTFDGGTTWIGFNSGTVE